MAVMAAGVHHSRILGRKSLPERTMLQILCFFHGERVNIKSQSGDRPLPAAEDSYHSRIPLFQFLCQKSGGCALLLHLAEMAFQNIWIRHTDTGFFPAYILSGEDFHAKLCQIFCNFSGSSHFQPAGFRVSVKITPELDKLVPLLLRHI